MTIVPYHLGSRTEFALPTPAAESRGPARGRGAKKKAGVATMTRPDDPGLPANRVPIAAVQYRQPARVAGRVHTVRVQPHGGIASLECTIVDETGGIALVFLGRRGIAGMKVGSRVVAEGMVGEDRGRLAILNPVYEFLPDPPADTRSP